MRTSASIGKGDMSEVYRVRGPRLNRDVDIKVFAAQFSERFERCALGELGLRRKGHQHVTG